MQANIIGAVLSDGTRIDYPSVFTKEQAWDYVNKHCSCPIQRHILATPANMPEVMSMNELRLFIENLD